MKIIYMLTILKIYGSLSITFAHFLVPLDPLIDISTKKIQTFPVANLLTRCGFMNEGHKAQSDSMYPHPASSRVCRAIKIFYICTNSQHAVGTGINWLCFNRW